MKKLLALIISALIVTFSLTAFADGKISAIECFSGNLYYCDDAGEAVVIKNIEPINKNDISTSMAKSAEYSEIKLTCGGLRLNDNSVIGLDWLNNYADGGIWFVMALTQNGELFIPYLKIK